MKEKAKVTVLMPVFNGEQYLRVAIESILQQTFTDFEFLIIDDGSTDDSLEIVKSYNDPRIRLEQNEQNLGLVETLNKGLDIAQGIYVARMDCDDISLPRRLQAQVEFMNANLAVGVCGTWYENFGNIAPNANTKMYFPVDYETIKAKLFFNSYLGHPTVMLRMSILNKYGLRYDPALLHAEDYGLWIKCSFLFPIANIPEVLLHYRISPTGICQLHKEEQRKTVMEIHKDNLKRLGIDNVDEETIRVHQHIVYMDGDFSDKNFIIKAQSWLKRLKDANQIVQCYPEPNFSNLLTEKENAICRRVLHSTSDELMLFAKCNQSDTGKIPIIVHTNCNVEWKHI